MRARYFIQMIVWGWLALYGVVSVAADSQGAAMSFVTKQGLGTNMSALAMQVAQRTGAYRSMVQAVGEAKAAVLLQGEMNVVSPKYQGQWNSNLAASHAEVFSAQELLSLAEDPRASPYFSKLMDNQDAVGQRMQNKSSDLLVSFVSEVMNNVAKKTLTQPH